MMSDGLFASGEIEGGDRRFDVAVVPVETP
jgi:hypothetical protein